MKLGAFSISLSVKDLAKSKTFDEALGFQSFAGAEDHGYLILKNADHLVGIFQGMFEGNILTFNPGWDQNAQPTATFTDVRELQAQLKAAGLDLDQEADPSGSGPAHFILRDPDGNTIMLDQHR